MVVQLGAHAQQEVVSPFQLLALALADKSVGLQVFQRTGAMLEERHPEEILEVPQPSAAVLEVGLLHAGGIS